MKDIVAIKSVDCRYFCIGKRNGRYFLKNEYTEIPNEFGYYDMGKVEQLFNDLRDGIIETMDSSLPLEIPETTLCKVIYEDKTEAPYKCRDGGINVRFLAGRVDGYSEFYERMFFGGKSKYISLDRLRWVCEDKEENIDVFLEALKDFDEDDYTSLEVIHNDDGSVSIDKICYGVRTKDYVTLDRMGVIGNDGEHLFVKLMKQNGVRVHEYPKWIWNDTMAEWYWRNVVKTELDYI